MSKWNTPAIEELSIRDTEHNWTGIYSDGGYIGDGQISGHSTWTRPDPDPVNPDPDPMS